MPLKLCGISGMRGAFSGEVASTGFFWDLRNGLRFHRHGWPPALYMEYNYPFIVSKREASWISPPMDHALGRTTAHEKG